MTKHYGDDKETDRAVQALVSREVLACQSSLIDALLALDSSAPGTILSDFSYEDIENLYPDPSDWTIEECQEYCVDYGIEADYESDDVDEWREAITDNAEPAEIFEWWLVTTWAAKQLRKQGQPILEVGNHTWWGRTCTGQSIVLDPTWYDIHAA